MSLPNGLGHSSVALHRNTAASSLSAVLCVAWAKRFSPRKRGGRSSGFAGSGSTSGRSTGGGRSSSGGRRWRWRSRARARRTRQRWVPSPPPLAFAGRAQGPAPRSLIGELFPREGLLSAGPAEDELWGKAGEGKFPVPGVSPLRSSDGGSCSMPARAPASLGEDRPPPRIDLHLGQR